MPDKRIEKRTNLLSGFEGKQIKALNDEIKKLSESKKLIDVATAQKLMELYENSAIELKKEKDNAEKQSKDTSLHDKLMKKISKDYIALKRYATRLEKEVEKDQKKAAKNQWTIDEFFDNTRTRVVKLSEEEVKSLGKAGAGQNVRYKVSFIVEDEPVEGKKVGDAATGFFTEEESYSKKDNADAILEKKRKEITKDIKEKYPEAKEFIADLGDVWKYFTSTAIGSRLRTSPSDFGTYFSIGESKRKFDESLMMVRGSNEASEKVSKINSVEKFYAFVEYTSAMLKAHYAMVAKNIINMDIHADSGKRNALASVMADLFGCSDVVAFSEKMNIETTENGEKKVMKGTIMMPAKGLDMMTAPSSSEFSDINKMSFEESKGLVEKVAKLGLFDYLIGNPDRHIGNVFLTLDENGKVNGVVGIDNDTCFSADPEVFKKMSGVELSKLKVIPADMAEKIKSVKPEMLEVMLHGYDLSQKEINMTVERFKDLQGKLLMMEKAYEKTDEKYINADVPRIVKEDKMDQLTFNEQLAEKNKKLSDHGNLFNKLSNHENQPEKYLKYAIENDSNHCANVASEIGKLVNVELKRNNKFLKDNSESKTVTNTLTKEQKKAYKDMVSANEKLREKTKDIRLIHASGSVAGAPYYEYTASLSGKNKTVIFNEIKNNIELTDKFIESVREQSLNAAGGKLGETNQEKTGKYEEYLSYKAEMDYFKSIKDEDSYNEAKEQFDKLEKDRDIIMIKTALKNRELLVKTLTKFEELDKALNDLTTGKTKYKCRSDVDPYVEFGRKARAKNAVLESKNIRKLGKVQGLDEIKPVSNKKVVSK